MPTGPSSLTAWWTSTRSSKTACEPGLDRAPGEVGVLAAVDPPERLDVEAADRLEHLARVEDVAGLKGGVVGGHSDRPRERPEPVGLLGVGLGAALDDRAGVLGAGGEAALEPLGRRHAVVVGERDQRRPRRPPPVLARGRPAPVLGVGDDPQVELAARELALEHLGGRVGRSVVDDHDLELVAGERLGAKRGEQALQLPGAVEGRDGDRHPR